MASLAITSALELICIHMMVAILHSFGTYGNLYIGLTFSYFVFKQNDIELLTMVCATRNKQGQYFPKAICKQVLGAMFIQEER